MPVSYLQHRSSIGQNLFRYSTIKHFTLKQHSNTKLKNIMLLGLILMIANTNINTPLKKPNDIKCIHKAQKTNLLPESSSLQFFFHYHNH